MGPNSQPPMNPTPPMASHNSPFLNIRPYRRQLWRSVNPLDAWVTFPTRSYPTTRSRYLERATQVRRIGRRKNRQWEGERTSCGLRRHLSAGTRACITEDDAFTDTLREAMSISRRASSRVRSTDEASSSGSSNSTLASDTAPPPVSTLLPHIYSGSVSACED